MVKVTLVFCIGPYLNLWFRPNPSLTLYTHILVQLRNKARDNKRVSMLEMGEQQQVILSQRMQLVLACLSLAQLCPTLFFFLFAKFS